VSTVPAPPEGGAPAEPGAVETIPVPAGDLPPEPELTSEDSGEAAGGSRYRALVVTASNRAAAGVYEDTGGPLIAAALTALGFAVDGPRVVPDGDPVERALREGVAAGYDAVVTTGGTGLTPTDRTPEATRAVLDREVPGIAEAIRFRGAAKVPTAVLSRGLAGVAGSTLIVNLPGSTGGVRDGMDVLAPLLRHAVDQIHGGDHPRGVA
jgi:molybdenum cofactor synthesis domain-containing protein